MNPWQGILSLAGLQADFEIVDVKQFRTSQRLELHLKRRDRAGRCSHCGERSKRVHSSDWVRLRDLPCFEYRVFLVVERLTIHCSRCRSYRVESLWLSRSRRDFTWRYEKHISKLCEETTNAAVGRLEGLNDKTVYNIDYELLQLRLTQQPPPLDTGPNYSMDEVHWRSFPSWHENNRVEFITNLVDLTHRKVITNSPGRDQKAAENCLLWLSSEQRDEVKAVAVDLHDPFISAIKSHCRNASIVLDRFHIMQLFSEAMNEFRKQQLNLADDSEEIHLLKGKFKWLLLTHPRKLSKTGKSFLEELKSLNERVIEALIIRDQLVHFFEATEIGEAKRRWGKFSDLVAEADIKPFNIFLIRMQKWLPLMWNYFHCKISSAVIEAINHKVKTVRSMAYGYRNRFYYQLKILQRVGFLNSRYWQFPVNQGEIA